MRTDFTAGTDDHGRRLESVVRKLLPHLNLGAVHRALRQGDIRLNGAKAQADSRVSAGDVVAVWDALTAQPSGKPAQPSLVSPVPAGWILLENDDLLAVNKPSGLLVHRGEGPVRGEAPLDDRVRAYLAPGLGSSLSFRPGPLHRLDRETSGLVVFSKTLTGARTFSDAVAGRQVTKTYLTVLRGSLDGPREVRDSLVRDEASRTTRTASEGAEALTRFTPLASARGLVLAEVDLGTGRTHQIRAHAQSLGLSLAGDGKYGGGSPPDGLDVPWLLHAWKLNCPLFEPLKAPLPPVRSAWVEKNFKISP